jgi:uncharacterized protein (TIGR00288 family)
MSPWWLRPPGDEPAESSDAEPRKAGDETEPASIADLMQPSREEAQDGPDEEPVIGDLLTTDETAAAPDTEDAAGSDAEPGEENGDEPPKRKRRRRRRRRGGGGGSAEEAGGASANARAGVDEDDEDDDDEDDDYENLARGILESLPVGSGRGASSEPEERKIALFCDLENIALGVRDSDVKRFEIHMVLERLLEKGKIIVKRAYADWERYSEFKVAFHEAAIELIDIPQRRYTGKNSADIKMVVDAMDLSYSKEHLDTFVVLSGDSDFSPLVSKLKENNKYVIGIGVKNSSSNLLVDNCDEFIYYEDVWRDRVKGPELTGLTKKKAEVFSLLTDSVLALQRENKDVFWGSLIKQTMQRKKPSFNEGYYGYSTFTELLQDAERHQIVKLKKDQRSGTHVVTGFAKRK